MILNGELVNCKHHTGKQLVFIIIIIMGTVHGVAKGG